MHEFLREKVLVPSPSTPGILPLSSFSCRSHNEKHGKWSATTEAKSDRTCVSVSDRHVPSVPRFGPARNRYEPICKEIRSSFCDDASPPDTENAPEHTNGKLYSTSASAVVSSSATTSPIIVNRTDCSPAARLHFISRLHQRRPCRTTIEVYHTVFPHSETPGTFFISLIL